MTASSTGPLAAVLKTSRTRPAKFAKSSTKAKFVQFDCLCATVYSYIPIRCPAMLFETTTPRKRLPTRSVPWFFVVVTLSRRQNVGDEHCRESLKWLNVYLLRRHGGSITVCSLEQPCEENTAALCPILSVRQIYSPIRGSGPWPAYRPAMSLAQLLCPICRS